MTTLPTEPDHLLSLAEWDALPEDTSRRYELVDGVVVVSPHPVVGHQRIAQRLTSYLDLGLPEAWEALMSIELTIVGEEPATVRVPDVVVLRSDSIDDRSRIRPDEVLAVAEVSWTGTRRTDRVAKRVDYAEAGVGCYLLVEPGPPSTLTEFRLRGAAYEQEAEHEGTANLVLDGSEIVVDLTWGRA